MKRCSPRLIYVRYAAEDLPRYLQLVTDPQVMKHIAGRALSPEEGKKRFEKALSFHEQDETTGNFMVFHRAKGHYLGFAKLIVEKGKEREAEVGYALLPAYWGKGYATEILEFLVAYARRLHRFDRLIALVDPENRVSVRILEKFGFTPFEEGMVGQLPVVYYEFCLDTALPR